MNGSILRAADKIKLVDGNDRISNYLKYHSERLSLDLDMAADRIEPGCKIVEVGGDPFILTLGLIEKGHDVTTVDFPSEGISSRAASLNINSTACDIEASPIPLPDNYADEIIFNEVFEHLRMDPIHTMSEVHRVLKPKGRLWLSTPNIKSLRGIVNFLFKSEAWSSCGEGLYQQYVAVHRKTGPMGHVREYTAKEVSGFLSKIGFVPEEVIYRGDYKSFTASFISYLLPSTRPYFTIISRKK